MGSRVITYASAAVAWKRFDRILDELTARDDVRRVCDVGGGSIPSLPLSKIAANGLEYTIVDVSAQQLDLAPAGYGKRAADLSRPNASAGGPYDLVVSRFLAEHISDPRAFHENVRSMLADGGRAFHFFSTLYAPPFVANRLLPEGVSNRIVRLLQPDRQSDDGHFKWPARYRWCRGPSSRQIARLERMSFVVESYAGFFGTRRYYERAKPFEVLDDWFTSRLVNHPVPHLTSYAQVLLYKPEGLAVGAAS